MLPYSSISLVSALLFLLMVVLTDMRVQAQDVIFGDEARRCPNGKCVHLRQCPSVLQTFRERRPVICRFERLTPIVCCPNPTDVTPNPPQDDISPPNTNFVCGKSTQKVTQLPPIGSIPAFFREKRQVRRSAVSPAGSLSQQSSVESLYPVGPTSQRRKRNSIVVGGVTSRRNAWPWMALLGHQESNGNIVWICGGVLINADWVLSAAHCFNREQPNVIRLGEHDHSDNNDGANHVDFGVAEIKLHPDYTRRQAYHDLALIRLSTSVTIQRFISPVCLPWGTTESNKDMTGRTVTLTGWGDTEYDGEASSVLQEVALTVFPTSRCDESYRNIPGFDQIWPQGIREETVCAGDPQGGRDACQGDSGGPIVSRSFPEGSYIVAGIVSKGYGCGLAAYPGLYANIRHKPYLSWIKRTAF